MIAARILGNVIPWLIEALSSVPTLAYRLVAVPPLAQGLIGVAVLVYHIILMAQAQKSFGLSSQAARENWGRPGPAQS